MSSTCSFPKSGGSRKTSPPLCFCVSALAEVKSFTNNLHSLPARVVLSLIGDQEMIWDLIRLLTAVDGVLRFGQVFIRSVCNVIAKIRPLSWQPWRCHPVNPAWRGKLSHSTLTLMICQYAELAEDSSDGKP